jgi:hydroxylaminobenzene mutase
MMENEYRMKRQADSLIFLGILLFLLGLIVGLFVPLFPNPRMGLSSHVEGVLNGMFLVILGLIWHKVALSENLLRYTYWLALYGTFANWSSILLAAIFNAGKMLGIAANGKQGHPVVEGIIAFMLITLSIAMVLICIFVLIGLRKNK